MHLITDQEKIRDKAYGGNKTGHKQPWSQFS
jgi:hypothetical protein